MFVQFLGGVSKKNVSIFQVLGTVYFEVCHIYLYLYESYTKYLYVSI